MLDILTIAVIFVFVIIGYKKGIARTALSFMTTLVSVMISIFLSNPIAEKIYDTAVKPSLTSKIESAVKTAATSGEKTLIDEILKTLPNPIRNSLPNFSITNEKLNSAISSSAQTVEGVLRPVIVSFMTYIICFILFIAISITARIVINIICDKMDVVTKGVIDSFFGSLVGLIEGFLIVTALTFILHIALPHIKEPPQLLSDETISQSYVFKRIYDSDILVELIEMTSGSANTGEL